MKRIKHLKVLSIAVAFILVFSVVFPLSTRAENSSEEKFTAEQSINGTKVTVSADPEVFPEGTTMEVKEVNLTSTEDSLVASQQQADQKSIKKVALDITMMNKEGQEIEPDTSKGKVHVSFTNDDIKNHTTNVYHIDDNLKVESLKLTKSDDTVTGETTGFSTYVLDFVVGDKTIYYGVTLNTEMDLSEVLASLLNIDASKITDVKPNNATGFNDYGSLTTRENHIYLTVKKELPAGDKLTLTVNYTDKDNKAATATLYIKVYQQPTFSGDASWINDYKAIRDDHAHTITLTKYIGTKTDLSIPPTVKINDVDYQVALTGNVYKQTSITSIVFNKDVTTGKSVQAAGSLAEMFAYCSSLLKVDLSGLDTSNVTDMSSMFEGTGNSFTNPLKNDGINSYILFSKKDGNGNVINSFNTRNVKNMNRMFIEMYFLQKLDVSSFNTTSLEEMDNFVTNDYSLTEINLSSFKGAISKNASDDAKAPLLNASKLNKITLGENWHARDYKIYASLGIDGNWKYTGPNVNFKNIVFSNEELNSSYYSQMAGTYEKTNEAPSSASRPLYVADGYVKKDNMWEVHTPQNTFHGYCLDHNRLAPSGYYDKVAINKNATSNTSAEGKPSNWIMDYLDEGNTGYKEIGSNMTEALIALIYWSEYGGNNGPYNQDDVWHFTNDYSSGISAELAKKIKGHTYNDIPNKEKYKLYIYMPSELNLSPEKDQMQNLLSIEGANDQAYAGVQIKKVDNTSSKAPVAGAKFAVYHANDDGTKDTDKKFGTGEDHLEFTTNSAGVGGIYRMDKTLGLTAGKYILEEMSAPSGYIRNGTSFKFDVTDNDDQKLITVGDSNGVIVDNIVPKYSGGGISLTKTDSNSGKLLANAEFTLYETDASGNILYKANSQPTYSKTYLTDATGIWKTGLKDLEIGKYYIVCETKAPEGYNLNQQSTNNPYQSSVIQLQSAEENSYKDIGVVTNVPQTVDIQIEAKKVFPGVDLANNKFTFNLKDSQGKIIDTQQNDATGNITFKKLTLSAADMPGKDYYIEEEQNTPTISGQTITYDTHRETVKVLLETDADGKLKATVKYSDDTNGAVFVNQLNVNYDGKLNVHKTVTNSLSSSDEFNFYVEIQSPAADLASKEFTYTLDGKTGIFKFNRLSTKTDTGLYRYKTAEGTFKLKDQSTLELTDLPRGAQYIVTEDEENGYKLVKLENTTGTLSETAVTAKFTNEGNSIIPTSADTMTRMSFWILGTAGALVFVLILKRRLKASKK